MDLEWNVTGMAVSRLHSYQCLHAPLPQGVWHPPSTAMVALNFCGEICKFMLALVEGGGWGRQHWDLGCPERLREPGLQQIVADAAQDANCHAREGKPILHTGRPGAA